MAFLFPFLIVLLGLVGSGHADYNFPLCCDRTLTLSEALTLTLDNNPELKAFEYDFRAGEGRLLQSSLHPNPLIDFQADNLGGGHKVARFDQSETTLLLCQLIELGGKRSARMELAASENQLIKLDYEIKKWDLLTEVYKQFVDLLVIQRKIHAKMEMLQLLEQFGPLVQKSVASGKASIFENTRFQIAVIKAKMDVEEEQRNYFKAYQSLATYWGEEGNNCYDIVGSIELLPPEYSWEQIQSNIENNPRLVRLYAEGERLDIIRCNEKKKAIPDVVVRAGPSYLNQEHSWTWTVGFTVPIPYFDQNQGNIQAAIEESAKIDDHITATRLSVTSDLKNSFQDMQLAKDKISVFQGVIIPQLKEAREASENGFEKGRYNYLDLLDIHSTYLKTYEEYYESLGDYQKSYADINGMLGHPFIPECEAYEYQ